jgi:hypothetical protein
LTSQASITSGAGVIVRADRAFVQRAVFARSGPGIADPESAIVIQTRAIGHRSTAYPNGADVHGRAGIEVIARSALTGWDRFADSCQSVAGSDVASVSKT